MKLLQAPLSEEDVTQLHAGELVMLSGDVFTCRSGFYRRLFDEGAKFPLDPLKNNVVLHSGPIIGKDEQGQYKCNAISITTSVRFNKWEPDLIEMLGLRAVIAKGRVGKETRAAMQRLKCVHLCRTGTFAGAFALRIKQINSVDWLDLGLPEALWNFKFEDFGPLIVETDTYGNSVYDAVAKDLEPRVEAAYERLGITGFKFAEK